MSKPKTEVQGPRPGFVNKDYADQQDKIEAETEPWTIRCYRCGEQVDIRSTARVDGLYTCENCIVKCPLYKWP